MADISKLNVNNTDYNIKDATARSDKTDKSDLTAISITGTKNNTGSTITINKFFYLNGELVIAKTDIADNATLTENTNYIKITAGILNGLYNILQDVTPTSSDKLLVVQSQGQGLVPYGSKLDSANPTGTGSLSLNRKANTTTGAFSSTLGSNNTVSGSYSHAEGEDNVITGSRGHAEGSENSISGNYSHAEGRGNIVSETYSHAEGYSNTVSSAYSHAEGRNTTASEQAAHAEGYLTVASGSLSHAEGDNTIGNHRAQHVFGAFNIADTSTAAASARGNYIEIVGKGTADNARSNARTLDWSGNEVLAGDLTINGGTSVGNILKYIGHIIFNSSSPAAIPKIAGGYGIYIVLGAFAGVSSMTLQIIISNNSIGSIVDMATGSAWSTSLYTFSYSSSTGLKIESSVSANSEISYIKSA